MHLFILCFELSRTTPTKLLESVKSNSRGKLSIQQGYRAVSSQVRPIRTYPEWICQGAAAGPTRMDLVLDIGNQFLELQKRSGVIMHRRDGLL